jgi:5-methylthioribose kinase
VNNNKYKIMKKIEEKKFTNAELENIQENLHQFDTLLPTEEWHKTIYQLCEEVKKLNNLPEGVEEILNGVDGIDKFVIGRRI